ncbi:MAG TPA: endo-1,4-beta-xylanase [Terriglobia bacterium]|nr:endo-1,4-beta-xylanase [Terriglobia bacterium]
MKKRPTEFSAYVDSAAWQRFRFGRSIRLAAVLVIGSLLLPAVSFAQSLREEAQKLGILVGAAVDPSLFSQPDYAATLARQFSMVEPENVMKWSTIEPARGQFNFGPGDEVVAFAEAHHMKVRGHNLLWDVYNPAWLAQGHFTPQQLREIMKNHITAEVRHYRGKVFAWDVVNEAIDSQGGMKHSIWYDKPGIGMAGQGTAYVAQAFRWAHAADPDALLFYNDYDAEGLNAKSNAIYKMVKDFKRRGVPINGVGLQMHLMNLKVPASIAANISRLTALGLEVHITEMDVALPIDAQGKVANSADLGKQAQIYRKIATICAQHPACTAFQTWGFTDKYSWIPHFTHEKKGDALLFDANYKPKPDYRAVLGAFRKAGRENPGIVKQRLQIERRLRGR